jgi:sarcosine oxidase subunit alpha
MGSIRFEGRRVPFEGTDTVASALYRRGVRTFTRSLKYHRRRGLYCGTGDCPNCLITVDGVPGVRSCTAPCADGMHVERESGWPSTDRDALHVTDRLHVLMPVGFYYKTFIRPRFAWEVAEKVIRRATGLGHLPEGRAVERKVFRHHRCDVLVVGAGAAGLEAALAAARDGDRVLLCDESTIGAAIPPGPTADRVRTLEAGVREHDGVTVLEGHAAIGIYEGPVVPLVSAEELVQVHPRRIVVATGATEAHAVFPGNDLPGVWLGRGAARMAGVHGVRPGEAAVVVAATEEGLEHLRTLREAGVRIVAAAVPAGLEAEVPGGIEVVTDGVVHEAVGRSALEAVVLRRGTQRRRFACDTLALSLGLVPRDDLARMAVLEPVDVVGDAAVMAAEPALGPDGYVCLCEDVSKHDLERAWDEGFRSSEILKRYTTTTMGPCTRRSRSARGCTRCTSPAPRWTGPAGGSVPGTTATGVRSTARSASG